MLKPRPWVLGSLVVLLLSLPALATSVTASIGTQHFTNNSFHLDNDYAAAGGTSPFDNSQCGGDDDSSGNCSATWSFSMGALNTVTGASFTIGLSSLDSIMSGNQLASFTIDGFDETSALNAAFEANPSVLRPTTSDGSTVTTEGWTFKGGSTQPCWSEIDGQNDICSEYNVYTVNLTDPGLLAALSGSGTQTVDFSLALQGPGAGIFTLDGGGNFTCLFDPENLFGSGLPQSDLSNPCPTTDNGARLDFSKFTINGSNGSTGVPEPSTMSLLIGGLAGLLAGRMRKQS